MIDDLIRMIAEKVNLFFNHLSIPDGNLNIKLEQKATLEEILLEAIPSLLGVLLGSLITLKLTVYSDEKKQRNLFIQSKQNDVYFPLIDKTERLLKKFKETDYIATHVGIKKEFKANSIRKTEWEDFIDSIKQETRPQHQGNYTRKIWNEMYKIRRAIEQFEDFYGKCSLKLLEIISPVIDNYLKKYLGSKGQDWIFKIDNTTAQIRLGFFEDRVLGVRNEHLLVSCVSEIRLATYGDMFKSFQYDTLEFSIMNEHRKLPDDEEMAIDIYKHLNDCLKREIPLSLVGLNIYKELPMGSLFMIENRKMLDEANKRYKKLLFRVDKFAKTMKNMVVVF